MSFDHENGKISGNKSQQEILLDKIRFILEKTDLERWKKGGEKLRDEQRFKKPQQAWEQVYTLDIPSGTLVLRASTSVKAEFAGKGFQLIPVAPPFYSTEIRAEGWHHSELTDPFKRSRIADRRCTVLAEGEIAEQLYMHIDKNYSSHYQEKQSKFDAEVYAYACKLPQRLKTDTLSDWERTDESDNTHYTAHFDGMSFDVSRTYINGREQYNMEVSKRDITSHLKDVGLAKDIYTAVEELGQTSRLATLTKALEQL